MILASYNSCGNPGMNIMRKAADLLAKVLRVLAWRQGLYVTSKSSMINSDHLHDLHRIVTNLAYVLSLN